MIGRQWNAWTSPENADAYEDLLRTEILPELDNVEGCQGAYVFRREDGSEVKFSVLHLFDSLAVVQEFAGDDYETAVVPEAARKLLDRYDATAEHFEVRAAPQAT